MTTITFDTHLAVEYLIKKGVKKPQAEAIIKTMQQSRDIDFNTFVTKEYLDAKFEALDARFEAQDMKLEAKLNKTKYEVVAWLIACTIAIIAILKH